MAPATRWHQGVMESEEMWFIRQIIMFVSPGPSRAIAWLILLTWLAAPTQAAERARERFDAEFPAASKRLADAYSHVSAKLTLGNRIVKDGTNPSGFPRSEYVVEIESSLKRSLLKKYADASGERKLDGEVVLVIGQSYSYEARRHFTQGGDFALTDFGDARNLAKRGLIDQKFRMGGANYVLAPIQSENMTFIDLLDHNLFNITSCESLNDKGIEIVKIEFINGKKK